MSPESSSTLTTADKLHTYIRSIDPSIFGFIPGDPVTLRALQSGCSNFNFHVSCNDISCVFRFSAKKCEEGMDRLGREYTILQHPALEGIAPRALHFGACDAIGRTILATEFIEGEHKNFNDLSDKEITALATRVSKLHTIRQPYYLSPDGVEKEGTYRDALATFLRFGVHERRVRMATHPDFYPEADGLLDEGLSQLETLISHSKDAFEGNMFSLTHHDINPENVLWRDGRPVFIDWEYGQSNDPAQEVSYLIINNYVDDEVTQKFLAAYQPPENDKGFFARMEVYTLANILDDVCWAREELFCATYPKEGFTPTQTPEYYKEAYTIRVALLKKYLRDLHSAL